MKTKIMAWVILFSLFVVVLMAQSTCQTVSPLQNCKDLLLLKGITVNGTYSIDPDGPQGPIPPFKVYCDMTTMGGGWTMIFGSKATTTSEVADGKTKIATPLSGYYLDAPLVQALALVSTEVLINSNDNPDRYIKNVDSFPIERLQILKRLNDPTEDTRTGQTPSAHWEGSQLATTAYWCTADSMGENNGTHYPQLYWACNNSHGLHYSASQHRFDYAAADENLNAFVR